MVEKHVCCGASCKSERNKKLEYLNYIDDLFVSCSHIENDFERENEKSKMNVRERYRVFQQIEIESDINTH